MNITAKILVSGLGITLVACGISTQSDIAQVAHAAKNEPDRIRQEDDARVAEAHAAASREINETLIKRYLKQAKADYGEAIAKADRDLSIAVEKCAAHPARARAACELGARSMRDQLAERAKINLSLADQ